mmetsp:Transcript_11951/g.34249  ORF Transcript_11951/g.34249 Transcript_11951/m.34249 type:complete len:202 (-) Transcript_11951:147-752(-)
MADPLVFGKFFQIFPKKFDECCRFFRCCLRVEGPALDNLSIWIEGPIGIDCVRIPSLDPFVAPGTDTRCDYYIEVFGINCSLGLQERQGALHAACFVAVNTTGNQNIRFALVPVTSPNGKEREGFDFAGSFAIGVLVMRQITVLCYLKQISIGLSQAFYTGENVFKIASLLDTGVPPLLLFGETPRFSSFADRECIGCNGA